MERKNLTYLADKIFEFIVNIEYEQSREFITFRLEMLINVNKFLKNYEQNIKNITNYKISKKPCSQKKEEFLNRLIQELIKFIKAIEPTKIQPTMNFEYDKTELIVGISKFLNPKNYHGNIEKLKELEELEKNKKYIDTKKYKC